MKAFTKHMEDFERENGMNRLKQNRAASFAVVTLVYMIAAIVGVMVYDALDLSWWLSLLIADGAATAATFVFSLIFKNASVYDPYWSVQPPAILAAFAIGKNLTLLGILLIAVVSFWAVRLTANWAYTFGDLTHQDWRYTMLHQKRVFSIPSSTSSAYIWSPHLWCTAVFCPLFMPSVKALLQMLQAFCSFVCLLLQR